MSPACAVVEMEVFTDGHRQDAASSDFRKPRPDMSTSRRVWHLKPYALKTHSVTANIGAKPLSPHFAKKAQLAHMCSSKPADQTIASELQRSCDVGSYTADKYVCSTEKKVASGVIVTKVLDDR